MSIQLTQDQKDAIELRSLMSFYDIEWEEAAALARCKAAAKAQVGAAADRRWASRFERDFVRGLRKQAA